MAIAISNLTNYGPGAGGSVTKTATITFDSSYPTGGEAVTAANFGLSRILSLTLAPNIGDPRPEHRLRRRVRPVDLEDQGVLDGGRDGCCARRGDQHDEHGDRGVRGRRRRDPLISHDPLIVLRPCQSPPNI